MSIIQKRYFITGTDTNCGKTYVTKQLINYLHASGHSALAVKPVASGCSLHDGELISADTEELIEANGAGSVPNITPWRFAPPIAPHLAAEQVQQMLCAEELTRFCCHPQFKAYEYFLIEGAGGLLVPLNRQQTWIDFLKLSQIPVILVVGMTLGCINHALLTVMALQQANILLAGWIANCLDESMLMLEENILTLKYRITAPLLAISKEGVLRTC